MYRLTFQHWKKQHNLCKGSIGYHQECHNRTDIWKSTHIGLFQNIQLDKSVVWRAALYGYESWAMEKTDEFEIWVWHRVLRVRCVNRRRMSGSDNWLACLKKRHC